MNVNEITKEFQTEIESTIKLFFRNLKNNETNLEMIDELNDLGKEIEKLIDAYINDYKNVEE